ncbi:MAG TPA: zinc-binding alcohol dehydrogenase family protein [Polyangia bacterium]|nr:zinc-binding alcohol dehydrogenase family protein [Polyangia bacterium]
MHAAVVRDFDTAPRYEELAVPPPAGEDEVWVEVLAAGLHPRVRSGASGTHYADARVLPMIPGIDAVGRLADGTLVYCVVHDTPFGTMAERVVADRRRCAPLPEGVDAAAIAAAMNPAMSSWLALRLRAAIQPGQSVFVLGATGNAGQMAVPIARLLGARRVVGAGRDASRLASSGADEVISLVGERGSVDARIAEVASESDVVLDYLWGEPAAQAMMAILTMRRDRARPIDWVQIGSMAGPTMSLPSMALRSTNIRVMGSGQGSVPLAQIVAELPHIADAIATGKIVVDARRVPLRDVERAWTAPVPAGQRVVLVP